jgi:eukaryotic-like serine/threonine-protein kinase
MKPERWQRINDLFQSATDCPPNQRDVFLYKACSGDESLRRDVESLVVAYERTDNFIETPAFEVAPELLVSENSGALIGESIGHYRIESLIGVGGMGEVYLARDERLGRKIALKLLPEQLTADETQVARFKTEARAASALNHPNILTVYEISSEGDRQFIATEFIDGVTLRTWLARGRINLHDALEIAVQIASGLAAAHSAGVVHRDIKPENIMLRPDGYVKVLDFGIAKLSEQQLATDHRDAGKIGVHQTRSGLLGTVRYMSPEQTRSETADTRSDIWSLGVVIYEMVAGIPPFQGKTASECITSIQTTTPPPLSKILPDVSLKLEAILKKALQKNKDARYQTSKEMLADLRSVKAETDAASFPRRHRLGPLLSLAGAIMVLCVSGLFLFRSMKTAHRIVATVRDSASNPAATASKIAVLPFENLSNDREDASFADGVQDDLLTKLAKIGDLKVISRTSVMEYRGKHNTREIGDALRVSHVLEGSVQKTGAWLHINIQLIDVGTDTHVWAEQYDRDLKDLFVVQSEIAQKVAEQLHAKISPAERLGIARPPTTDITAFDLYNRAKNLVLAWHYSTNDRSSLLQAADLLNQAVAHDPSFFQAYCQLAWTHDQLYFFGFDHTPARLALAEATIQAAATLRPDAAETHLARAQNLYWGHRDYDNALAELEAAGETLPNNPRLFELRGYIERRQGKLEEALHNLERALELDPRNFFVLLQTSTTYHALRRYAQEETVLNRALVIMPDDAETKVSRASMALEWKADTHPLHEVIDEIQAKAPGTIQDIADSWIYCALAEHDPTAATNALAASGENGLRGETVNFSPRFVEGLIARMTKDDSKAHTAFSAARTEQEKIVHADPQDAGALSVLGLIDAGLGRKEEALREGRRAVELLPVEKDALNGPRMIGYLAMIAAWVGDNDLACEQLAIAVRYPNTPTYGQLKLFPFWDPLRGEPCFEKIVNSLAPR